MKPRTKRRLRLTAGILLGCIPAFLVVQRFTFHPGETVILLMPPAFGAFLWLGWPRVRRIRRRRLLLYLVVLLATVTGAECVAAYFVGGRVLPCEVAYGTYFIIAWRLAWEIWKRTVGRLGEAHRRHTRIMRANSQRNAKGLWLPASLIKPLRFTLLVVVFVPLLVGSLIHRVKIGNPRDMHDYETIDLQPASMRTPDGLTLSGWFLPEKRSNSTVIICHGSGANKANFIGFLILFRGNGFNGLIFDFRGHGDSDGHTTTFGLLESRDVTAAVDWLKKNHPREAEHVFALGSSMGAMALVRAAADDPRIEAVVLDSCFTSAPDFLDYHLAKLPVIGRLMKPLLIAGASVQAGHSFWNLDAHDSIARMSPRPVFLIHGDQDHMIHPSNMDILFQCAREPRQKWLGPGPHSNVLAVDYDEYQRRVVSFFKRAISSPRMPEVTTKTAS